MIFLHNENTGKTILLFGKGAVGSSVLSSLIRCGGFQVGEIHFPWGIDNAEIRHRAWSAIKSRIKNFGLTRPGEIHVVWSAGKAGMNASAKETYIELENYRESVTCIQSVLTNQGASVHFHLISSVGALFEGLRCISNSSPINQNKPYSKLKKSQEDIALLADFTTVSIYRLTSVISKFQYGRRNGLVPTLAYNAILNRESLIFGRLSTLRDYIWVEDASRFISEQINFQNITKNTTYLLGSGKPTTIRDIIHRVEIAMQKPLRKRFLIGSTFNDLDITISPPCLPSNLKISNLNSVISNVCDSKEFAAI